MFEFLVAVLGLFDKTLNAMLGVPVLAFFLTGFLLLSVLGLFLMLKELAAGHRLRRG